MKMVHITKTPDGGYFIVDATGAPGGGASFAPTSSASTEEGVKAALEKFGLTAKAIESAIRQVNETGNRLYSFDAQQTIRGCGAVRCDSLRLPTLTIRKEQT